MTEPTFTRQQILDAVTLKPCHITGEHDPTHTPDRVCASQTAAAFRGLLALLDVEVEDLPRALHDTCYWCNNVPTQEEYRVQQRRLHEWAA